MGVVHADVVAGHQGHRGRHGVVAGQGRIGERGVGRAQHGVVAVFELQEIAVGKEGAHAEGVFVGLGNTAFGVVVVAVGLGFEARPHGQLENRPEFQLGLQPHGAARVGEAFPDVQVAAANGEEAVEFVAGLKVDPFLRLGLRRVQIDVRQGGIGERVDVLFQDGVVEALVLGEGIAVGIVEANVVVAVKAEEIEVVELGVGAHEIGLGIIAQFEVRAVHAQFRVFTLHGDVAESGLGVKTQHPAVVAGVGVGEGAVEAGDLGVHHLEFGIVIGIAHQQHLEVVPGRHHEVSVVVEGSVGGEAEFGPDERIHLQMRAPEGFAQRVLAVGEVDVVRGVGRAALQ